MIPIDVNSRWKTKEEGSRVEESRQIGAFFGFVVALLHLNLCNICTNTIMFVSR